MDTPYQVKLFRQLFGHQRQGLAVVFQRVGFENQMVMFRGFTGKSPLRKSA